MAGNTTTSKKYAGMQPATAEPAEPSKTASYGNRGPKNKGQMESVHIKDPAFATPLQDISARLTGIEGTHNDIGELSGFITDGYLDKNGTPFGEAAKFNYLPPGMEITNQMNAEIHEMPMRMLVAESYPEDGWKPTPRDMPE